MGLRAILRIRLLQLAWWLGLWRAQDRVVLEDIILPRCGAAGGKILFAGIRFYTRRYQKKSGDAQLVTLDRDPAMRRWGSADHVVASLEDVACCFPAESFDHVIVNGVIGWGLDKPLQVNRALAACYTVLKPGWLVLGLNEERPQTPVIDGLPALRLFRPTTFPTLGGERIVVQTPFAERSHTYRFFKREDAHQARRTGTFA